MVLKTIIFFAALISLCVVSADAQTDTAYFWAGGYFEDEVWHDTIYADINQTVEVPIYFCGGQNISAGFLNYWLIVKKYIFDQFNEGQCQYHWPFNSGDDGWEYKTFGSYDEYYNHNPAYHRLLFMGRCIYNCFDGSDWLYAEIPTHILTFAVRSSNNYYLMGRFFDDAIIPGDYSSIGPIIIADSINGENYPVRPFNAVVKFNGEIQSGSIQGYVSDLYDEPIESVHVAVETDTSGIVAEAYTNAAGFYFIDDLVLGEYKLTFSKELYVDVIIYEYELILLENTLDVTLYSAIVDDVVIRAGKLDGSPIRAPIGEWIDIPIYCQTGETAYIADIRYPLGARYDLIDSFDISGCNWDYWPFNGGQFGWGTRIFGNYNDDTHPTHPNPPGYHSLTFVGYPWFPDAEFLHSESPIHILDFRVHIAYNSDSASQIITDALAPGMDPLSGPTDCGDTLGMGGYQAIEYFNPVYIAAFEYVLGDANMYLGGWPPMAIGGDVTYLVNYFRSFPSSQACPLDGFWASADVNGDCNVIGSDVTRLVNYFKGNIDIVNCPDYPSMWPTPGDIPEEAPEGWPNCE